MNHRLKSVTLSLILITTNSAFATLVDFNIHPNQANYAGNSDFTVTTYGGPETDINLNPHIHGGQLVNSSDPFNTSSAYPTEDIIDFDFASGLDSITVDMFWAGNPAAYGSYSSGVTISSYDSLGNILQTFGYQNSYHSIYNFDSIDLIYSIQTNTNLTSTRDNWWYGINSINYEIGTEVSEPTTLLMLCLGLVGFAASRQRIL